MTTWVIKSTNLVALALLGTTACAPSEQLLDKRQAKLAELENIGSGNSEPVVPKPPGDTPPVAMPAPAPVELPVAEVKFPASTLAAAKGLESIMPPDVLLMSKVSATEIIIFAKDGKSYSYKPEASAATDVLKPIEAVVVPPAGSTLYSLPDSQFWFVSADKIGRHKPLTAATEANDRSITVEQFSTKTFQGDLSKMKVLYVSPDEVIFHLDTYIAIISVKTSPAQIKQLPLAKLPVDLSGALMAGRSSDGYWFKTASNIFLLAAKETEDASPWTKSELALMPADISMLAMWPDANGGKTNGANVAFATAGFFSDVPASPPQQ